MIVSPHKPRVLEGERNLALACGFKEETPCWKTLVRRFRALDDEIANTAKVIASRLILSGVASKEKVVVDSTILKAKGTPAQKNYPRVVPTDPDASLRILSSKGLPLRLQASFEFISWRGYRSFIL